MNALTYRLKDKYRHWAKWARTHPRRVRAIATLAIVLTVLGAFLLPFVVPDGDARHLSAYADGLQDLSEVREEIAAVSLSRDGEAPAALATSPYFLTSIRDAERHVLFVFGVERPYTDGEAQAILDFVEAGGTLVLANDVGHANLLSEKFGVVFGDKTILDRKSYQSEPRFPIVKVPFERGEYEVVMNAPSFAAVVNEGAVEVLASSSADSFIDVNGDRVIDRGDQPGPFPLVMRTTYGAGRVILIADTGLFMNEMIGLAGYDNAAFARALAGYALVAGEAGAPPQALIDESRHVAPPSSRTGAEALRIFVLTTTTPTFRAAVAILVLGAAALAVYLTKGTEDWSTHLFDVGHERRAPETLSPTPERLTALAARLISEKYNVPFEYLEAASVDEVARLTGDRELAAVAKGTQRVGDPRAILLKLTENVPIQVTKQEVPS